MKHLNGNILCVVDVETTGPRPRHNDIIEVCVLPLTHKLEPSREIVPFNPFLVPKRMENIDFEALRIQNRRYEDEVLKDDIVKNKDQILDATIKGLDAYKAADLFVEWFQKLNLAPRKRIMPVAHNWCFDREFLIDWLGLETFNDIFDPRYRDTMAMSLYENDKADWFIEQFPYPKNHLQFLCSQLKVSRERGHTALDDCVATAEVYRRMIQKSR